MPLSDQQSDDRDKAEDELIEFLKVMDERMKEIAKTKEKR